MKMNFLNPDFENIKISKENFECVVGIDEVGRGSWAGPVAVGGYIITTQSNFCEGIQDSKLLKPVQREDRYEHLSKGKFLVKFGDVELIDSVGIGKTIEKLILEIVEDVRNSYKRPFFIIDGQFRKDFGQDTIKRIKADSTYYSVAAASILAKVQRDSLMKSLHSEFPEYGFETNVGYPTKKHLDALSVYGPTKLHRKSFTPIGKMFKHPKN